MLNLVGADLRVSIPAAGALVTAYAPGLGIGEPIDRADGWNLVAGVSLHRPRSVPPYVPDITARFRGGLSLTSRLGGRGYCYHDLR